MRSRKCVLYARAATWFALLLGAMVRLEEPTPEIVPQRRIAAARQLGRRTAFIDFAVSRSLWLVR